MKWPVNLAFIHQNIYGFIQCRAALRAARMQPASFALCAARKMNKHILLAENEKRPAFFWRPDVFST